MNGNRPTSRTATQQGSALVLVLLLTLVAAAIGGTLLIMSGFDHRVAANERDAEQALQAAKAGVSYAYHEFQAGALAASEAGTDFNSFGASVSSALEGAEFAGRIKDLSTLMGQGQLYMITSTGTYHDSTRTTEMVFQMIPDAFKFGYMAFNQATLHNHSGLAGPTFTIDSTIASNGSVSVPDQITINGTIVAADAVSIDTGSIIKRDVFAHAVTNKGTIEGKVKLLTAVQEIDPSSVVYNRIDAYGNKYNWWAGNSTPGTYGGGGPVNGGTSSYGVVNGDIFSTDLFNMNGILLPQPNVNVVKYIVPPLIDFKAMREEALKNDMTYFPTELDAVNYLITKKVNETIGGRNVTSIRVGTPSKPELLYIDDDFQLTLVTSGGDSPGSSKIQADGLFIEGGVFITGSFNYTGPNFITASPPYPATPDYYMLKINALPYCYPALLAYEEPAAGTWDTWVPEDTPALGSGPSIDMSASGNEGPSMFNGVVFSQNDIHMHHTKDPREVIRFNGAELGWTLHNCDYFKFTYDPQVRCTRFFFSASGDPGVVSYREVR